MPRAPASELAGGVEGCARMPDVVTEVGAIGVEPSDVGASSVAIDARAEGTVPFVPLWRTSRPKKRSGAAVLFVRGSCDVPNSMRAGSDRVLWSASSLSPSGAPPRGETLSPSSLRSTSVELSPRNLRALCAFDGVADCVCVCDDSLGSRRKKCGKKEEEEIRCERRCGVVPDDTLGERGERASGDAAGDDAGGGALAEAPGAPAECSGDACAYDGLGGDAGVSLMCCIDANACSDARGSLRGGNAGATEYEIARAWRAAACCCCVSGLLDSSVGMCEGARLGEATGVLCTPVGKRSPSCADHRGVASSPMPTWPDRS